MSQQIAAVNLANASVGTTGSVSWGKLLTPPTIEQQMRPGQTSAATLLIHNESGAQLLLTFPDTGRSISFPAGKWAALLVRANEQSVTYKVTAIAPSPLFTSLLVDFYWPGEPIDPMGTLGNSPIGGPAVAVTQVIQDGQPTGQTIVEATPSGLGQKLLMTTDGNFVLVKIAFLSTLATNATIDWESNLVVFRTPESGATQQAHVMQIWDGAASQNSFGVGSGASGTANTWVGNTGMIGAVASQATAGSFGVPMIVAQSALRVPVTTTGDQTILSFAPPAVGKYRVSGYASENNGSATTITFRFTWSDPDNGGTSTGYFTAGVAGTQTDMNALSFGAGANNFHTSSHDIVANTGTNIIVHWNNSAGTPNDHITAQIERLQ